MVTLKSQLKFILVFFNRLHDLAKFRKSFTSLHTPLPSIMPYVPK